MARGCSVTILIEIVAAYFLWGSEIDHTLRWLSGLMVVMVVVVVVGCRRHVPSSRGSWGDIRRVYYIGGAVTLAMGRGAVLGVLAFFTLVGMGSWTQPLGLVQKVTKSRLFPSVLIGGFRVSIRSGVSPFLRRMAVSTARIYFRGLPILALSHRCCSFGNWGRVWSIAVHLILNGLYEVVSLQWLLVEEIVSLRAVALCGLWTLGRLSQLLSLAKLLLIDKGWRSCGLISQTKLRRLFHTVETIWFRCWVGLRQAEILEVRAFILIVKGVFTWRFTPMALL